MNNFYIDEGKLTYEVLDGWWTDAGQFESLLRANSLVAEKLKQVVENDATRPDVAIVAYSYNSNFEKLTMLRGEDRQKFLRRVEWKSIARRSAIYNFVIEDLLRRVAYYRLRHLLMAGTLDTLKGMDDLDVNQFNRNLEQSLELCRSHHVQLMFLMLGSDGQTPEMPMHPFQKAMIDFAGKENELKGVDSLVEGSFLGNLAQMPLGVPQVSGAETITLSETTADEFVLLWARHRAAPE